MNTDLLPFSDVLLSSPQRRLLFLLSVQAKDALFQNYCSGVPKHRIVMIYCLRGKIGADRVKQIDFSWIAKVCRWYWSRSPEVCRFLEWGKKFRHIPDVLQPGFQAKTGCYLF